MEFVYRPIKTFLVKKGNKTGQLQSFLESVENEDNDFDGIKCRVEKVFKGSVSRNFKCFGAEELEIIIRENPKESYHELLNDHYNRAFFDIESDNDVAIHKIIEYLIVWFVKQTDQAMKNCLVTEACKKDKTSYHLIYPIVMH